MSNTTLLESVVPLSTALHIYKYVLEVPTIVVVGSQVYTVPFVAPEPAIISDAVPNAVVLF